jgi:LPXTG-site transpeptidase (sortase) family protein
MSPKKFHRKSPIGIVYLGLLLFTILVVLAFDRSTLQNSIVVPPAAKNTAKITTEQIDIGLPVRLQISAIKVDATIKPVGLTSNGAMDVLDSPVDVAWYQLGKRPGEVGSAVLAGHYGTWENGQGSVFDNLSKLQKGDKISVTDERGLITTFVVQRSQSYNSQADASDVFLSDDGKAHLNLITCEGIWDNVSQSYPKRLIIFSNKE